MKKLFLFFTLLLSLVIVQAQNNCPLRMKVTTAPGDCYNNSFIQIDLVNADGTPLDTTILTDLSNFKFFCINTATNDTIYSYLNSFTIAPGTYIVGAQAICHRSYDDVENAYVIVDTSTTVTTTTTYVTPALSMINKSATSKTAYGTVPSLPCMNTGRVQLMITGGKFPYHIAVLDENEQPLDTLVVTGPMYDGTTLTDYNYKDYYSIDGLAAGKYFFYVWDDCGYHLPKVWQTVPTAEAPYISNVCWYNYASGWSDINKFKYKLTVTANGFYKDAITEMIEYRFIYPEINGIQDTSEWRHLSSNSTSFTLTESVSRAHSYCDMWGKDIKIESRTNVCNDHRTVWTLPILKPEVDIQMETTMEIDSADSTSRIYDDCGFHYPYVAHMYGYYRHYVQLKPFGKSKTSCDYGSNEIPSSDQRTYTLSPSYYWVYTDSVTDRVIKIDTFLIPDNVNKSYIARQDIEAVYGRTIDSSIVIPVRRTLYDAKGCELYTRVDSLNFGCFTIIPDEDEPRYFRRSFDCNYGIHDANGRRYLKLTDHYPFPMWLNGNCKIELISSPNDNWYNYTATYNQVAQHWTVSKANPDNQAIITLDTSGINAKISDFCMPNGLYVYRVTTPCRIDTIPCTMNFIDFNFESETVETPKDYCCENTRSLRLHEIPYEFENQIGRIPLEEKGDCTLKLIESPLNNQFNFTATYSQTTGQWTVTKHNAANLATIEFEPSDDVDVYLRDYCLPSGRYTWEFTTPCATSTYTCTASFLDHIEFDITQQPRYEFTPNCTELTIKPLAGRYSLTKSNTYTSGDNVNQPWSSTQELAARFVVVSGPTGGYTGSTIAKNGTTRITIPGTYVIKMYHSDYNSNGCVAPVVYDTIHFNGGTVEYEYDYAYLCDSNSTTGYVRVKGKNGTEPYTYTLYSGPNMQGSILGENTTGIFDDVPLRDGQQISVKIEDACRASFDVSFYVFDLQKASKCWFTNGMRVSEACEGSYVNVYAVGLEDEATYLWSGPNGFSANTRDAEIFVPRGSESGWYHVNISHLGCLLSVEDSVYLSVKRAANVAIAEDATICPGEPVTLNFTTSGGTGDVHYTIAHEENSVITMETYTNNDTYTYEPTSSGIFWVHSLYDDECHYNIPFDTVTITLNNHFSTACDVITIPDTVCPEEDAMVYAYSNLATPYTLRWYEDYTQTNLLKEEVVHSASDRSQYAFNHLMQDTALYVTVQNDEYCESRYGTVLSWMNMNSGTTNLRCGESIRFYDSRGVTADYLTNESSVHTFTSTDGNPVTLSFSKFNVESEYDKMLVFTGATTNQDSLIATLSGNLNSNLPEPVVSSGNSLTVWFLSNAVNQYEGWEATVSNSPKPAIAEAIITDSVDVQLTPLTTMPVHYNGDVTMQAVANGGRHQLYQYIWQTSVDNLNWNTFATVTTSDTSRQTLTHLTESAYVRVMVSDQSAEACDGTDTAVYFLHIGNVKLSLQLELSQDYTCSPYYTGTLSVSNSAADLAEQVTAKLRLPEGLTLVTPGSTDFDFGNIAAGETATANIQVMATQRRATATELIAQAQIWSCAQGDSEMSVVYGDWDWTGTPRQADEDTALVRVEAAIPIDLYNLTALNKSVCYGYDAELQASSNLSGTQYFYWYEDASLEHLFASAVVTTAGENAHCTIPNVQEEKTLYVTVGTDEFCPLETYLQPQTVTVKEPLGKEVITATTDDLVCYDYTAHLTASSSLSYPQYYNWWDKDMTTLLYRDTVTSGVSHFNPEHQISDSLYYVYVYNDATCPYVPELHDIFINEWVGDFLMTPDQSNKVTTLAYGDSLNFYDEGGKTNSYPCKNRDCCHTFKAEDGKQVVLQLTSFSIVDLGYDWMCIYDGPNPIASCRLDSLDGGIRRYDLPRTYVSTTGCLTVRWVTSAVGGTRYSGWEGSITTAYTNAYLTEAHVFIKAPLGKEVITATDDAVCFDGTATLTASSDIAYPQYYTWWDMDMDTLLYTDTVTSGVSHFYPEHQVGDSLYYVHVYNDNTCPYVPSVHKHQLLPAYNMNEETVSTTYLNCCDSIPFYDAGGKGGGVSSYSTYKHIFKAKPGHQVTIHIDTLSIANYATLYIYDGETSSGRCLGTPMGNKANLTYTSTKGALYVKHSSTSLMGWEGSVVSDGCGIVDLAEAHVSIKSPLGKEVVATTDDAVCYDGTAALTASSSLNYPQYYSWWNKEMDTLLYTEKVTSGVSHFYPEHQIGDSIFYVSVYDSLNCPNIPSIYAHQLLPAYNMNETTRSTTYLNCRDSIPFYDAGGKSGKVVYSATYQHVFKAEPGNQVTIHIDTLNLTTTNRYYLSIYDGETTSGTLLASLNGKKSNLTYTSTTGALYVRHSSNGGNYMGWEGSVVSDGCEIIDLAEAHVSIKAPVGKKAITTTDDAVCYNGTATLTASSSLNYPQYYSWWASDGTTLLAQDTVWSAGEKTHLTVEHQISDSLYYVSVYDSLNCPYVPEAQSILSVGLVESNVKIKEPLIGAAVTATNDAVCYDGTADLTASSNIGYPQNYTWYKADRTTVLKSETINSGVSHFNPEHQMEHSLYFVRVDNDTSCPFIPELYGDNQYFTESFVSIKAPLGKEAITATDDTVCYGGTAALTASSDIDYPQYYTWWDKDLTTLLYSDTVTSGVSHFNPKHQTSDSLYYVIIHNDSTCPYIPEIHKDLGSKQWKGDFLFSLDKDDGTTYLFCGDSLNFYDDGGPLNNALVYPDRPYTISHTFKAVDGAQVILTINSMINDPERTMMYVFDGDGSSRPLTNLYKSFDEPRTFTSTTGMLTLHWYCPRQETNIPIGWEGTITTTCNTLMPGAESRVYMKSPTVQDFIMVTSDTVCYGDTAHLIASSNLDYPQYYTWMDKDMTTVLKCDTVTSGSSHFNPKKQISDSLYFVRIDNETTCPYIPGVNDGISGLQWKGDFLMDVSVAGKTTLLSCGDSINFYDDGGLSGEYSYCDDEDDEYCSLDYYHTFKAEGGSQVILQLTSFESESGYDKMWIYDGESVTSPFIAILEGDLNSDMPMTFTSTNGSLTVRWVSDYSSTYPGWEGSIITDCEFFVKSHVSIRLPLGQNDLTVNDDAVCYGNTAHLIASSNLDYPQYYIWMDKDRTTVLGRDTVTLGSSLFNLENQIGDSSYCVLVYNNTTCPYIPGVYDGISSHQWKGNFLMDVSVAGETTLLSCGDSINFYDDGGQMYEYSYCEDEDEEDCSLDYYHTFKAEDGSQVILQLTSFESESGYDYMCIYDGPVPSADYLLDSLDGYYDAINNSYTSTSGSLTVRWVSDYSSTYPGWEGTINTTCELPYWVESYVTVHPYIAPTDLTAETCQSSVPYSCEIFNNVDVSIAGSYTIDSVFQSVVTGCDSIVTLHLTVNPSYNQEENVTICENELAFTWRDTTFLAGTVSGDYVFNRNTVNGCDSIVTLHLMVKPSSNDSENLTICQSELPYEWRDTTFLAGTTTGDYVFHRQAVNGCDSIVTLHLTVKPAAVYLGSAVITATHDTVCYDNTAALTASSTLGYPQYFTWWDKNMNVLAYDTISSGVSHFNPANQIKDSLYYVTVTNDTTCPFALDSYMEMGWNTDFHMTLDKANQATGLSCGEGLNFYFDAKEVDYGDDLDFYHTFKVEPGKQVVFNLNQYIRPYSHNGLRAPFRMEVYDGETTSSPLLNIFDANSRTTPYTCTSTNGSLTIRIKTHGLYMFLASSDEFIWRGTVSTSCVPYAESRVKIRRPLGKDAITATNDTVCYGNTANLTATSSLAYPQYFDWWNNDHTMLLASDTVYSAGEISHFKPEYQISDSIYYVNVYDSLNCRFDPNGSISTRDFWMTMDQASHSTTIYCGDTLNFYDSAGPDEGYSPDNVPENQNRPSRIHHTFVAESGKQVVLTMNMINIGYPDNLYIYDGPSTESPLLQHWNGYSDNMTHLESFTSTNGSLTVEWVLHAEGPYAPGWDATITTDCDFFAESHVTIRKPLNSDVVTTSDVVCYDNTAHLTASSNLDYPQYYNWWAKDKTTLLGSDTVYSADEVAHFNPEHQIFDSVYYVNVYDSLNCPYDPEAPAYTSSEDNNWLDDFNMHPRYDGKTTQLNCGDILNFYDSGGKTGNYFRGVNTNHTFKAPSGGQVVLTLNSVEFPYDCCELSVYDGDNSRLFVDYGKKIYPQTITSMAGSLKIEWFSSDNCSPKAGWEGTVSAVCPVEQLAEAQVAVHPYIAPTDLTTETCQSSEPYSYEIFKNIDVSTAGVYTIDTVFESAVTGCDSTVTLHLTVNPSYNQEENVTICEKELAYTWRDTIFLAGTITGDYVFNRQTALGCDSIVTLHLTVTASYNQSEDLTICQSELPYTWRDTTFKAETVTGDYVFNRQTVNGCDSIVTLHLTVKPAALDMDNLTDYIRCNGESFSVTPTGNIPEGTQYIWEVDPNASVTGKVDQSTPVDAPISQTLKNISNVKQTVVYHVTPVTDGCMGDEFTITVEVEPTPELTLNCPADITRTLEYGSCALMIAPEDLGTPEWAHSLGWVLVNVSSDAPEDNMYPEGDNVITWTMEDECGNTQTCEQHVFVIFPQCPDAVDYEGNVYHGVRIDCDCWTQRNLESNKYSDGSDIPGVHNYYSDMYPDVDDNVNKFGRLYDWESAINDGADNGYGHVQGICPEGWYLPTAEKYESLNLHGADALKSPLYWLDGGGSNTTGFTSLPAGYYDGSIGRYINLMGEAYYWSTTNVGGNVQSGAFVIKHLCEEVSETNIREGLGYSVRCIKEKE